MLVPVIGVIDINQTTWRQFGCFVATPLPADSPCDRQIMRAFVPARTRLFCWPIAISWLVLRTGLPVQSSLNCDRGSLVHGARYRNCRGESKKKPNVKSRYLASPFQLHRVSFSISGNAT